MALCRMREIVPAWLPEQPISVLLTSVPTAQPAAENHTGLLQAAWGLPSLEGCWVAIQGSPPLFYLFICQEWENTWLLRVWNTMGQGGRGLVWAWTPCWLGTEPAPFAFGSAHVP